MTQPALDRRTFLTLGIAGGLCALGGFGAPGATLDEPIVLKPFAQSRTVTTFAQGLFFHEEAMPLTLRRAIEAELARADVPNRWYWEKHPAGGASRPDSDADREERRRAAFFAWLAVEYLAPLALRRAGYEQMAIDVASGTLPPAGAQHTIGRQYARRGLRPMPMRASCAYGTSAHASTTAFYADHRDIDVVAQTGYFCARALIDASFYDDEIVVTDAAGVWDFATLAINTAIGLPDAGAGEVLS